MLKNLRLFISKLDQKFTVNVVMRDIEDQVQWYEHYREYVPVLVVNDEEVCHYFLDSEELSTAIGRLLDYPECRVYYDEKSD